MKRFLLQLMLYLPSVALAELWTFGDPTTVAGATDAPHFHHLDGAGRQHIAASGVQVALASDGRGRIAAIPGPDSGK